LLNAGIILINGERSGLELQAAEAKVRNPRGQVCKPRTGKRALQSPPL